MKITEANLKCIDQSWEKFFSEEKKFLDDLNLNSPYTPKADDIFKVFQLKKEAIRFVIIGQDPYPQTNHATGRSFEREIDDWSKVNKSLQAIMASVYYGKNNFVKTIVEILQEIDNGYFEISKPRDLFKELEAKEGVFFLNKSLTTEIGVKNAHALLWKPFTENLVKHLSKNHSIKWLLWGKEAQELESFIENKASIISTIHPAAFSYTGGIESERRYKKFVIESGMDAIINSKAPFTTRTQINDVDEKIQVLQDEIDRLKSLKQNVSITVFNDPEIEDLKIRIEFLQNELIQLENEKIEIEKQIIEFNHRFNSELGEIILDILSYKKKLVQDDKEKLEEATNTEEQFKTQFQTEKKRNILELSHSDKQTIKTLRNKAAKLCHPDKFQDESDEVKKKAHDISLELNDAYRNNDLNRVIQLLKLLENGELTVSETNKPQGKDRLLLKLEYLSAQIELIQNELLNQKNTPAYQKIVSIESFDTYFNELKLELESELNQLKMVCKQQQ